MLLDARCHAKGAVNSHALPYHCHHSCSACVSRYRRYAKKLTAKQNDKFENEHCTGKQGML